MKRIIFLSNYGDLDTRYGDCIMIKNVNEFTIYDCGHERHAEEALCIIEQDRMASIVNIIVSHNDLDHTNGVISLMRELVARKYKVNLYVALYLKHVDAILEHVTLNIKRDTVKKRILEYFDNIQDIVNMANQLGIPVYDALEGMKINGVRFIGPTMEEYVDVVSTAINEHGEGVFEGESIQNAASIRLEVAVLKDKMLLSGDASPNMLKRLDEYYYIQIPHHGKLESGEEIVDKLYDAYQHCFIISDNSGSAEHSGGSDELMKLFDRKKINNVYNTKNGVVYLDDTCSGNINGGCLSAIYSNLQRRRF